MRAGGGDLFGVRADELRGDFEDGAEGDVWGGVVVGIWDAAVLFA